MKSVLLNQITGGRYDEYACCCALDRAEELILNYCNLDSVPEGLSQTLLSMAAELLLDPVYDPDQAGWVTSVTVGDARAEKSGVQPVSGAALTEKYRTALNRYRKVRFG